MSQLSRALARSPLRAAILPLALLPVVSAPRSAEARELLGPAQAEAPVEETLRGERLDPATHGPARVSSMAAIVARDLARVAGPEPDRRARGGRPGAWIVPSPSATHGVHSGLHAAVNEWGDVRMGIGFPAPVDLEGVWIAGQAGPGVWPPAVRAVGYRAGREVGASAWLRSMGAEAAWLEIGLDGVDRVVFEALPAIGRAAWFAIDDLSYAAVGTAGARRVVIDFEDCEYSQRLSGSHYRGLHWETGTGFDGDGTPAAVPSPQPAGEEPGDAAGGNGPPAGGFLGGGGTAPVLVYDFAGLRRFEGDWSYPPDTCGAIGPAHFAEIVNRAFAVYDRTNGSKLVGVLLSSLLPGANGDPRILFDQHSGRWVAIASDFTSRIQIGISLTDDPTGDWFTTDFLASQGSDAGCWPDYPTLGVDQHGIYVGAFMAPGCAMALFAIDKAPLIAPNPSLGAVTAFRDLPQEGALQPAHTWGAAAGEYVVSITSPDRLRIRRVNPPLANPTLSTVGLVTVGPYPSAPDAPALGSVTPIETVGNRLINAVYSDGSLWTTHHVRVDDRGAARWYELDVAAPALVQSGTVADPEHHFYFPSIAVNADGDVALGFSGSSPTRFVGAWFTGRLASDPPGEMAPPIEYRAGSAPYNVLDGLGRNRWGDYSLTTLDPNDERTLWTLQEFTQATDIWGTWVGQLEFGGTLICPDQQPYCASSPNSVGPGALMSSAGSTSASLQDLVLVATGCPSSQVGAFYYGYNQIQLPFGDGFRCVGGGTFRLPATATDSFGDGTLSVDFTQPPAGGGPGELVAGSVWNFQFWYRDPDAGGAGFNLSNGLELTMCP